MARTLIGQLIFRLRNEGLGEANDVIRKIKDVENAAKRLGQTGTASWGTAFQRNLDKLKLTQDEIRSVEGSWLQLHESMKSRNLAKALEKSEVSHWKTGMVSQLAQQRAEVDKHFRTMEGMANRHAGVMRAIFVSMGFYTAAYGGGMAIRGALGAASQSTRTKYRMELANIPADEQEKMSAEAGRLSAKYGSIDETDILELNKTAFALFGGDGEKARSLMETLVKSFIADVTAVGVEKAGDNLSSFLKAMDNLNVNEGADGGVPNIEAILDGWARAKQLEQDDLDVGDLLGFSRRAKVAKYALDDDFLTNYLPALGQDQGFDALGDSLSGAFQNLVTPSAGGTQGLYIKRQTAMGLRDRDNRLVEMEQFAANPYRWTIDVLKPLLAQGGVDVDSTAAVAEAVKKLMSNSKAAAAVTGWIAAENQIEKNVALYRGATGLGDTENARQKDPYAAAESLMAALRNLSAAILPMEAAATGLNAIADAVNRLAAFSKDHPLSAALGMGGFAVGGVATGKFAMTRMADMFGLKGSAIALDGSAAALTRAAVALGGSSVGELPGGPGGKKGGGLRNLLRNGTLMSPNLIAGTAAAYSLQELVEGLSIDYRAQEMLPPAQTYDQGADANSANHHRQYHGEYFEGGWHRVGRGAAPAPAPGGGFSAITKEAARAGQEIQDSLSVHATPQVDTGPIDAAIGKAQRLLSLLNQTGAAVLESARDTDAQLRRSMSDYGVAP